MFAVSQATLDDAAQLAELLGILFAHEVDFVPNFEKQLRAVRAILGPPATGVFFVARESVPSEPHDPPSSLGPILGTACLLFTISTAAGGPACLLEDVIVRLDWRGAGVGSALLAHAIDFARAGGYARIVLQTDHDNEGAQRLYGRFGFKPSRMLTMRLGLSD